MVAIMIVIGVSVMAFVTTNPVELVLATIGFGIMAWQGLRDREGGTK